METITSTKTSCVVPFGNHSAIEISSEDGKKFAAILECDDYYQSSPEPISDELYNALLNHLISTNNCTITNQ